MTPPKTYMLMLTAGLWQVGSGTTLRSWGLTAGSSITEELEILELCLISFSVSSGWDEPCHHKHKARWPRNWAMKLWAKINPFLGRADFLRESPPLHSHSAELSYHLSPRLWHFTQGLMKPPDSQEQEMNRSHWHWICSERNKPSLEAVETPRRHTV